MNQQDSAPTDRCNILFFDPVRSSSEPRELQYPGGLKEDASSPQMPREDVCDGIREPQRAPESEFIRNSFAIRERKALAPTVETGGTQKGRMRKVQCACRECRQDKVGYLRSAVLSMLTPSRDDTAATIPSLGTDVKDAQGKGRNALGIDSGRLPTTVRSRLQTLPSDLHLYHKIVGGHHRMFRRPISTKY